MEDHAAKLSKLKALETLTALELFQDDAELLRCRDRRVMDSLIGAANGAEAEDMADRNTILADNITIIQRSADTAAPGGEGPKEAAPAQTIGRAVGQLARAALLASVGGTVLGAVLGMVCPGLVGTPAAPPPPAAPVAVVEPPERIPPPQPAVPDVPSRESHRRISLGP